MGRRALEDSLAGLDLEAEVLVMSVADVFIPDPSTKKMIVVVRDMCRRQLSGRGKMHSTCWGKPKFWQDRLVNRSNRRFQTGLSAITPKLIPPHGQ